MKVVIRVQEEVIQLWWFVIMIALQIVSEELQLAKERDEVKIQQLERQASIEKRQVYEDAFLEQMNYYIQHGRTEGMKKQNT